MIFGNEKETVIKLNHVVYLIETSDERAFSSLSISQVLQRFLLLIQP